MSRKTQTFAVTVSWEEESGINPEMELMTAVTDYCASPFKCLAVTSLEKAGETEFTDMPKVVERDGVFDDYEGPDNPTSLPPPMPFVLTPEQRERLKQLKRHYALADAGHLFKLRAYRMKHPSLSFGQAIDGLFAEEVANGKSLAASTEPKLDVLLDLGDGRESSWL